MKPVLNKLKNQISAKKRKNTKELQVSTHKTHCPTDQNDKIDKIEPFISKQTNKAMRTTIQSVIDLVEILLFQIFGLKRGDLLKTVKVLISNSLVTLHTTTFFSYLAFF